MGQHLTTVVANFWRMASSPWRERGVRGTPALDPSLLARAPAQQLWRFMPTLEEPFHHLLAATELRFEDFTFVDLGSGKGRSLLLASSYPFRRIVGVELSPSLHYRRAQSRSIVRRRSARDFELVCMDAAEYAFPSEPLLL